MKTLYSDFESIDEVLAIASLPLPDGSSDSSVSNGADEEWDLSLGYQGAMDAYTGGWSEGARKAQDLADTLTPRPRASRTTLRSSVAGGFPNIGAHLAGAPMSMYTVGKKAAQGKPFVHIVVPIAYSCRIKAETAFSQGCAMVALIDAMENAGCRVKVTLVRASDLHSNSRYAMRFAVKDYSDRLDLDQVMFTAAHPAFFRRIVFALQERSEHKAARDQTQRGYGSACSVLAEDVPEDGNAIRVILPSLTRNGGTPETFLAAMVNSLPEDIQTEIA